MKTDTIEKLIDKHEYDRDNRYHEKIGQGTCNIIIRQEQPKYYEEVYALVEKSFATASHSDGDEADYLNEVKGLAQKTKALIGLSTSLMPWALGRFLRFTAFSEPRHPPLRSDTERKTRIKCLSSLFIRLSMGV
jgi:hypothetical protein